MADLEEVYSLQEVAERLKVNIRTLHRWRKKGKLKAHRVGHFWRVRQSELQRLLGDESAPVDPMLEIDAQIEMDSRD